ncbi:MAG: hypothetical protein M0Z78_08800 [Betaproteobacteria bacterium]|nr:hypothetical protein [Betaproteobacteria bacterium]
MIFDKTTDYAPKPNNNNPVGYIPLTPVDDADEKSNYFSALKFAIDSEHICNIALTGPFGSGKSSIIKTFEKNNQYKFLNISLASFKEEAENQISNNLIERSILQQMLYGTDASKLPYSRFKRIAVPNKPLIKSALFVFWALVIGYIYLNRVDLLSLNSFNIRNTINVFLILYALAFLIALVLNIYKSFFGITLKKLSLKNAEIEAVDTPENSILNRHLDEIIYFFQEVDYNVVVIEDLDRFNSPEIFVKLREINKLINDNSPRSKKIKFLYALKDDMFIHNNRVKFFDFIIPVIPIVNSSNSLEMMRRRLKDNQNTDKIAEHFIRDVALYIDDMRLIHNIFNEFALYKSELHSDSLNSTKLLAMMIYKNVYPDDFEKLHHGEGALYEIGNLRATLIISNKQKMNDEIASLKKDLAASDEEEVENEHELISIFIGHIVSSTDQPVHAVYINQQPKLFSQLKDWELFAQLFDVPNVILSYVQPGYNPRQYPLGKSFDKLQSEISPNQTFAQRKEKIENKAAARRLEIHTRIHELEQLKGAISQLPLYELILKSNFDIDEALSSNKISNMQPLTYLIKNGYLDETHYLYTSKFYEGQLTRNDHDFLVTIRDFKKPDPKQPIDTPYEVCLSMRPEDFAHNYTLNVALVDYLLTDNANNREYLRSAVRFISTNFSDSEEFFTAYWDIGQNVVGFVRAIAELWPGYGSAAVKSPRAPEHLALILQHVDENHVVEKMNSGSNLTCFLATDGYLVYASDITPPDNYVVLKKLKVVFGSLANLAGNKNLIAFAHHENLYEINPENIGLLLDTYSVNKVASHLEHTDANYSAISAYGSPELKGYVDENLSLYLDKVFFTLPTNTKETPDIIKLLLNSDQISNEQKIKIVSTQEVKFESFTGLPDYLWGDILSSEKVNVSWENILCYLSYENLEKGAVTHLFNRTSVVDVLSEQKIDGIDAKGETLLAEFIFGNDAINDSGYCKLVPCLTTKYTDFPGTISSEKAKCLIKANAVELSVSTFKSVKDDNLLAAMLLGYNVAEYIANKQEYPITDDIRAKLLLNNMSTKQRYEICLDATPEGVIANEELAKQIAEVLKLPNTDYSPFDSRVIATAIASVRQTDSSVQILIKCIPAWDREMIMKTLEQLPAPYSEITEYSRSPKIPDTPTNRLLAKLLVEHGIVSSISEKKDSIRINTFKSAD